MRSIEPGISRFSGAQSRTIVRSRGPPRNDGETIKSPASKRTRKNPAAIHLAHVEQGVWISSFTLEVGSGGMTSLPSLHSFTETFPTRGQAIRGAVSDMTRVMQSSSYAKSKEAPIVNTWLDKLYAMPDPDWTPELAAKYAAAKEVS